MTLPVAILAGGLATRLFPLTETVPKSLMNVADKPFIVRQLDYLRRQGIDRVVLCVSHLGEQIQAVVGDGSAFGLDVRYSWDGPTLLGTRGALRQALPLLSEKFFVFYGDSYLPIDFRAVEQRFVEVGKPGLMTVLRNENKWDTSNVLLEEGRIVEYNKRTRRPGMAHIDYGLSVLSSSIVDDPATDATDLADIYRSLSLRGLLAGFEVFQRFYEVGSHEGLREAADFFRKQEAT